MVKPLLDPFKEMIESSLDPDPGTIQRRRDMDQMPFEPNEIMWSSIPNSNKIHKNQEIAKKASEQLFNLDVLRNGVPYVTMANIYAQAGSEVISSGCESVILNGYPSKRVRQFLI
ncbi:unnamed protein product [Fraxinus pennsylvanica]|uniref:Uncharacterized protein n=1 Tax=Fraxinus pennsylvanica TaxID=56036 RepID=A0AAD2A317_9LAMI|nr:unnamed protein product [Fraxinus pennsylvanica]